MQHREGKNFNSYEKEENMKTHIKPLTTCLMLLTGFSAAQATPRLADQSGTLALTELGWTADQDSQPYTLKIQAEQADRHAWNQLLTKQGHQLTTVDCKLSDWQTLPAGSQIKFDESSLASCLHDSAAGKSIDWQAQLVYVILAEAMPGTLDQQAVELLTVDSAENQQPWFSRQLKYDGVIPVSREYLYLSNQCDEGWCEPQAFLKTADTDVDLRLSLKGVYHRDAKQADGFSLKGATNFTNGEFNNKGDGWSWFNELNTSDSECFATNSGPNNFQYPNVKNDLNNNFAFSGGTTADFTHEVHTSSVEQSIRQVPDFAELNFSIGLFAPARGDNLNTDAYMRVVAQDMNTNTQDEIFNTSTSNGDFSLRSFDVDVSKFAGHSVNFRFEVCSKIKSLLHNSATLGIMHLDDVSLLIQTPPEASGTLTHDGPCTADLNGTCDINLDWSAQDHQTACLWEVTDQVKRLSCSTDNKGSYTYQDATVQSDPVYIDLLNHSQTPPDSLAGYTAGSQLDSAEIQVNPTPPVEGTLNSNAPCTLQPGDTRCTTQLSITTVNVPLNCLWATEPNLRLVSCSEEAVRQVNWPHTVPTGHQFELRAYQDEPTDNNSGFINGIFLASEYVYAEEATIIDGDLTSNSPCTIQPGASKCTTVLNITSVHAPVNCLWTTAPNLRLVSCSTTPDRSFNWPHTVPTGHQFELRAHDAVPVQSNNDRLNGQLLGSEFVYAEPASTTTGTLTSNSPCTINPGATKCTTVLNITTVDATVNCLWTTAPNLRLVSCSTTPDRSFNWPHTVPTGHQFELRAHDAVPVQSNNDRLNGQLLGSEFVYAEPASTTTGTLTSNSPCTINPGSIKCTTILNITTVDATVNCLWTTAPNLRLVSCSATANRSFNWPHTVPTGHQFELRAHDAVPAQTNNDRLSGGLLDSEYVYAVEGATPDYYDNVALRGYSDNSPGDAAILSAGDVAQQHNFHVAGDEDWTIFALGDGQGVRVQTFQDGNTAAKMVAYRVDGPYQQIAPNRWDISLSDLTFLTSDTSSGNNQLDIINNTGELQVYVIKSYGSSAGNDTAYRISSSGL